MRTQVIFRLWRKSIIALFPYEIADLQGNCLSYQHVGQHGAADYSAIIAQSRPAIPAEYISLSNELENNLGYQLEEIKRRNRERYLSALNEIRLSCSEASPTPRAYGSQGSSKSHLVLKEII